MSDLFKKAFSLGLGLTLVSKEKIEKTVDDLVERGKLAPGESKALVERLLERGEEEQGQLKRVIQEQVKRVLQEAGVASENDVNHLEQRVAVLEKQLAELGQSQAPQPQADETQAASEDSPPLKGNEIE
ncbi:phasin family protein [Paenibacillus barcinonensis]|uniref:Phasin family protein n=1 Tax=Paenibacillus barcinonensis TaxID=198119 RepID=A0A2V4W6Z0_PAEBA|nr:phasin family protein [Paenibacillus barcinonensis]PYE50778.1 polyhydroxyalkanoate synthesis regulator phasin [Paenibacillus barcinonensis]QKS57457.1 phasin family protein [Paenibacillus barcinonensis]